MTSSSTQHPSTSKPPSFSFFEECKIRCWTGLTFGALWLLGKTIHKRYVDAEEILACWQRGEQIIMAFWHSRILLMPFPYRGRKACIMNSVHRDGEIITRVIKRFGIAAVRGSSTRGWMGGLKGMLEAYRHGYDLIVVPDGPRGPRYRAKPGALQLARTTGARVFPVTYAAAWKITLKSWDRLVIPLPWSRVTYVVGNPVEVPADASAEQMEEKRQELEDTLVSITARADRYFEDKRSAISDQRSASDQPPPALHQTRRAFPSEAMTLFFYNLLLTLLALFALPFAGVALLLRPRYRLGLRQRLGFLPPEVRRRLASDSPLWLHAPSVGEITATQPFLRVLKRTFPHKPLILSVLTPTAYEAARTRLSEADAVLYFPLDHPLFVRRVLKHLKPAAFFFTETELWPNVLSGLAWQGVPRFLVSGRFSTRAAARYRFLGPVFSHVFQNLTLCCMQTHADAARLITAGVPQERVTVTGNFKVDAVNPRQGAGSSILQEAGLAARTLLVAASTHQGEEDILLQAYRQLRLTVPDLLLLLAPRHPQRFAEVEKKLQKDGYRYEKRSQRSATQHKSIEVFLLDTLGELSSFYSSAALVFVGGSLVTGPGGHSVIEPALARVPVCFGPYTRNFAAVVEALKREGGGIEVYDVESLCEQTLPLLTNVYTRQEAGRRAYEVIRREQGAVERTLTAVLECLRASNHPQL